MKILIFKKPYKGFKPGEICELTDNFANECIKAKVARTATLSDDIKELKAAGDGMIKALKAMAPPRSARPSQRHALTVKLVELTEELAELNSQFEAIRYSDKVEPWIKESFKLDIALKLRTRATVVNYLEKNRFPLD